MRRIGILLLTILLTTISCFSQNTSEEIKQDSTVSITSEQLKYANLIFVEHEKLLNENQLLYTQIDNYQKKLELSEQIDSLKNQQIGEYKALNDSYYNYIYKLEKDIAKKNRTVTGITLGGVTIGVGLLLLLIFK